jgi:hypothetical protein
MTKTERWLNLLAFLLDRHYPASREEILSQVSDYKEDWVGGDKRARVSARCHRPSLTSGDNQGGSTMRPIIELSAAIAWSSSPPYSMTCRRRSADARCRAGDISL